MELMKYGSLLVFVTACFGCDPSPKVQQDDFCYANFGTFIDYISFFFVKVRIIIIYYWKSFKNRCVALRWQMITFKSNRSFKSSLPYMECFTTYSKLFVYSYSIFLMRLNGQNDFSTTRI